MRVGTWMRSSNSRSDNRKSIDSAHDKSKTCTEPFDSAQDKLRRRIQNRKWAGFVAVVIFLLVGGVAMAEAQPTKKIPLIGFLSSRSSDT
jgi:hypothetical protein